MTNKLPPFRRNTLMLRVSKIVDANPTKEIIKQELFNEASKPTDTT